MTNTPVEMLAIQAKQLNRNFGELKAIDGLDLEIEKNEFTAF
ncbi:hypothetical protein GLIP_0359 [Aliiglaciecola lipolytica E3]|uniref:Uncharacterized protein n=1 Tax=Aliiglaciecola lipolytica E3 TaxID=1127673 RepID=K6XMU9_9ALTE|nr:hypothetical protein GLIP_0359 [Aliiglaciecola lipolytica E3]